MSSRKWNWCEWQKMVIPSRTLWGSWAQKPFCVPHFLITGNRLFFSLHDALWIPTGRFKQLLIREGRGCGTREKQTVKSLSRVCHTAALGQGPDSPSRDIHNNTFELFYRYWSPHQVEEVTCMLPTSMETPD